MERQENGNYSFSEPAQKAEMKQSVTESDLKAMGLSDEQISALQGIKSGTTANMEASFGGIGSSLDKVAGMEIMGIPLGSAALGGALAIIIDRIAIAKLDPDHKYGSWVNLAAALVIKKWGNKLIGNKAADATAMILTYEAVADWVTQAIDKVWPASMSQSFKQPMQQPMRQISAGRNDYYGQALGR